MGKSITFSEYTDLILARLYQLEQNGVTGYVDINGLDSTLKVLKPGEWVMDAAKVLQSRGLVQAIFGLGGYGLIALTGEGRIYFEENRGTGIIKEFKNDPGQFVLEMDDEDSLRRKVAPKNNIREERKPAFDLLEKIRAILKADPSLSDDVIKERETDIDTIKAQLQKLEPNRAVLASLLDDLSKVPSILTKVAELIQLLNP